LSATTCSTTPRWYGPTPARPPSDVLMTAVEVHGPYDFYEAFTFPPDGTMDRV
jgi:hypothetical protein